MAENYSVNYNIKVNSSGVEAAVKNFSEFTNTLKQLQNTVSAFTQQVNTSIASIRKPLSEKHTLKIDTKKANQKLNAIIQKLEKIQAMSKNAGVVAGGAAGKNSAKNGGAASSKSGGTTMITGGTSSSTSTKSANANKTKTSSSGFSRTSPKASMNTRGDVAYRALGPSMLDSGGVGVFNMLKGMGIAYGITGLASMMGNIVSDAAKYDNIIATTRNILKSHDTRDGFNERFGIMEKVVRDIGVATKFSAPEVADASKFLAMAGFNIENISKSISPIANMALIGDIELGETADVVTNIMTGYGITSEGIKHASDIMANTFTMSNTTLMEIAEAYKYSASLLSSSGVSFEEATAGIGVLGNAGIKSSQAGTTMRTILSNLLKPTKQQAAEWERVGVQRFDKNGNLRDLVDIFSDLNAAGLSVDQVFKMFHRTAAQGAVALVRNVDIWNNIIKENFLSDGLADKLAEEKKNTIQGLWAQLTSMFTENGMKAFSGLDNQIRDMLKSTIEWLHTPEAADMMKRILGTLMDLISSVKTLTAFLLDFYTRFESIIKLWLKAQMYMAPVIISLRIFRALLNFKTFVMAGALSIGNLAKSFGVLSLSLNSVKKAWHGAGAMWGTMKQFGSYNGIKQPVAGSPIPLHLQNSGYNPYFAGGKVHRDVMYKKPYNIGGVLLNTGGTSTPKYIDRTVGIGSSFGLDRQTRTIYNQKAYIAESIRPYAAGFGAMAGSIGGMYLGSMIGEQGSWTSMIGAGLGSMALGAGGAWAAGTVAPWLATTAIPFLLTNPVGWGILVAGALAGGVAAFVNYQNAVEAANEANNKYLASTASINGISLSEHASTTDKYLSVIYDKQASVNDLIAKHIELVGKQLGMFDEASNKLSGKTFGETNKEQLENASKADPLAPIMLSNGQEDEGMKIGPKVLENGVYKYMFNGKARSTSFLNAARLLYGMGRDVANNSQLIDRRNYYTSRMLMSGKVEDFDNIATDALANGKIKNYVVGSENWSISELEHRTDADWRRSWDYVQGFNEMIVKFFDLTTSTPANEMLINYRKILEAASKGEVGQDLISNFMLSSGIAAFDPRLGAFGSDEYMKNFSWENGDWKGFWKDIIDPNTGVKKSIYVSAEQARDAFLAFHQQIVDLVNRVSPQVRSYFDSFLQHPVWSFVGTLNGPKPENGQNGHATINGEKWDFSLVDGNWHNGLKIMSNEDMQKKLAETKSTSGFNTGGGTSGSGGTGGKKTGGGRTGANASDYSSHYKNNVVPKQVIVRIGNLMNVDKVDLSNPDNAAVISSLKSELAQALVDVVHDFDETWNG